MTKTRKPKAPVAPKAPKAPKTHDDYIRQVFKLALRERSCTDADRAILRDVRLAYGDGEAGTLGITRYNKWKKADGGLTHWCAVCATCQPEGAFLLAETVLHELGHAIAQGAGHGPGWVEASKRLGLIDAKATYRHGDKPVFSPTMLAALERLPEPTEGRPVYGASTVPGLPPVAPPIRPCGAGVGTKGGKSRGPGSGTRNALHQCACVPPVRVRAAVSKRPLLATCGHCNGPFVRV